jgi:hypothetical protein
MLGRFNDAELSRRLRRSYDDVRKQRQRLKIAPLKPKAKWRNWKRDEEKLLGTMPDEEVAKRTRRSVSSVAGHRFYLGIQMRNPRVQLWQKSEERIPGHCLRQGNRCLGWDARWTRSGSGGRHLAIPAPPRMLPNSWKPEEDRLLGTTSDEEIARQLNRGVHGVKARRRKLGIPAGITTTTPTALDARGRPSARHGSG